MALFRSTWFMYYTLGSVSSSGESQAFCKWAWSCILHPSKQSGSHHSAHIQTSSLGLAVPWDIQNNPRNEIFRHPMPLPAHRASQRVTRLKGSGFTVRGTTWQESKDNILSITKSTARKKLCVKSPESYKSLQNIKQCRDVPLHIPISPSLRVSAFQVSFLPPLLPLLSFTPGVTDWPIATERTTPQVFCDPLRDVPGRETLAHLLDELSVPCEWANCWGTVNGTRLLENNFSVIVIQPCFEHPAEFGSRIQYKSHLHYQCRVGFPIHGIPW